MLYKYHNRIVINCFVLKQYTVTYYKRRLIEKSQPFTLIRLESNGLQVTFIRVCSILILGVHDQDGRAIVVYDAAVVKRAALTFTDIAKVILYYSTIPVR